MRSNQFCLIIVPHRLPTWGAFYGFVRFIRKTKMLDLLDQSDFSGYTLVLPSVAVGNVGQLSVDLLVSTLDLHLAGHILDTSFIPLVGADPYNVKSKDICTAIDLYVSHEKKLLVIQIRSPLVKKPTSFVHEIINFVTLQSIAKVIILTSSFGHERHDDQIRTVPFRFIASHNVNTEDTEQFKDLSWIALEPRLKIHGGGFAKTLFKALQNIDVPCIMLLKFCSEGDNIPDAIELVNYFNQWVKFIPKDNKNICKLLFPPSWKFLFGNSAPKEIY